MENSQSQSRLYLTRKEAAQYLRLSPKTLANWAVTGKHLPFSRAGAKIIYRKKDIESYLDRHRVGGGE
ncbi:helix-turn-helix domain-containing protein [Vibrio fluvialis]|nr:helix-turn-helix domain-containing protein [Vibrio fluvialis]